MYVVNVSDSVIVYNKYSIGILMTLTLYNDIIDRQSVLYIIVHVYGDDSMIGIDV